MRWPVVVPAVVFLSALAYSLVSAPFAFLFLGESVYQWPDGRITFLSSLSILFVLLAGRALCRPGTQKVLAATCGVVSGVNLALFVVFNYGTNLPDGLLPQLFSANSASTVLRWMYWERLSPIYGLAAQAGAWFVAVVVSFFALKLPRGVDVAALDAAAFASCVLALYALGVLLIIPQWSARAVTGLQSGTILSWFTNDDLLAFSAAILLLLLAVRIGSLRQVQNRVR
jgi:hypothetical protein